MWLGRTVYMDHLDDTALIDLASSLVHERDLLFVFIGFAFTIYGGIKLFATIYMGHIWRYRRIKIKQVNECRN